MFDPATVILVTTQAELDAAYTALVSGQGGTILLAEGGSFSVGATASDWANSRTDAAVTIRSANPNHPAVIERLALTHAENLTIENVHFHMDGDDTTHSDVIVQLNNCRNVTIRNCTMTSDADGPPGTDAGHAEAAQGVIIRSSAGIVLEGNTLGKLSHGVTIKDSHDVQIVDNDIRALQCDGIRVAGVDGLLIAGNHLHDMIGSTHEYNHDDMIQIWGTGITVNNQNITIRENILDCGNGARYQMIFGHNEMFEANGLTFSNILVEGNVIFGASAHAISLDDTDGTIVRHNTIIHNADAHVILADGSRVGTTQINTIRIGGTNAVIENNITQSVSGGTDNVILTTQSPWHADDYRSHFVNIEAGGSGDLRDLMLRPDSPLNGVAGSWLTWSSDTASTLTAVADVTVSRSNHSLVLLDADLSRGPNGYVADKGATFTWLFDDGTTVTGPSVQHDFLTAGRHGYQLTVTMPDGSSDTIARTLDIANETAFSLIVRGDIVIDDSGSNTSFTLHAGAGIVDGWVEIGGRDRVEVSRYTESLFNLNGFKLGLTVDAETGATGTLLHLPQTFKAALATDGFLEVTLTTTEGVFTLRSSRPPFADGAEHQITVLYDDAANRLSLVIDGRIDRETAAHGITPPKAYWGLTIGDAWGSGLEARVKDIFLVTEADGAATGPSHAEQHLADGRRVVTSYENGLRTGLEQIDAADAFDWRWQSFSYDATGRMTRSESIDDAGVKVVRTFSEGGETSTVKTDVEDSESWASRTILHDAAGKVRSDTTVQDDGRVSETRFVDGLRVQLHEIDPNGTASWTERTTGYDASGRINGTEIAYADGRLVVSGYENGLRSRVFVTDPGDRFDWTSQTTDYDSSGRRVRTEIVQDDGRNIVTDFVGNTRAHAIEIDGADRFAWAVKTYSFDDGGAIAALVTVMDNGNRQEMRYDHGVLQLRVDSDVADAYDWSRKVIDYANGHPASLTTHYDNGTVDVIVYDFI